MGTFRFNFPKSSEKGQDMRSSKGEKGEFNEKI
jgi:hypothetical protein